MDVPVRGERGEVNGESPRKDKGETVPKEAKVDVCGGVAWVGEGEVNNGKKRNKLDRRAGLSAARGGYY